MHIVPSMGLARYPPLPTPLEARDQARMSIAHLLLVRALGLVRKEDKDTLRASVAIPRLVAVPVSMSEWSWRWSRISSPKRGGAPHTGSFKSCSRRRHHRGYQKEASPPHEASHCATVTPRHATPRHATPRHATPRHATSQTPMALPPLRHLPNRDHHALSQALAARAHCARVVGWRKVLRQRIVASRI